MVVGTEPIFYAPALPPVHFSPPMGQIGAQGIGASPPPMSSHIMQPSSPISITPPSGSPPVFTHATCPVNVNGNDVVTYNQAPNLYNGISLIPINSTVSPKDCQTSPSSISISPSIYSNYQSLPSSGITYPYTRIFNSTAVPCTAGLCHIAPELCTINKFYTPVSLTESIVQTNVVSPWKQSYGMEQVWRKEFSNLFFSYTRSCNHLWTLLHVCERPGGVWYENVDSAKVRFCCDTCGHGWTSMKGRVAFWFILNHATNEGVVCLKLYGQQCDKCKSGLFEQAMWYPEEVLKVMVNIYNKVGQVYYGFQQAPYHKTRRPGKPRTPHNSNLCQACQDGVCSERK